MDVKYQDLGVFIFNLVKDFYDKVLLQKVKPQKNEWTIISSIIMQNGDQFNVICFSNGTKSLPNKNYYNKNFQIFDCHTEIITLKALQFFLIKCLSYNILRLYSNEKFIENVLEEKDYDQFEANKEFFDIFDFSDCRKIKLKQNIHFHLYISNPPCGDCSINDTIRFGAKTLEDSVKFYESNENILKITIANNNKGLYRTKSIRNDFKKDVLSFSLSCSDKLMFKTIFGFQGKILSKIISKIFLSTITISNKSKVYVIEQCKDGINPLKRGINMKNKQPVIIFIEEEIEALNYSCINKKNEKNAQPYTSFWYFPTTVQKIDPVTGLKCGCKIDDCAELDKFRVTISKYDLLLATFYLLVFISKNDIDICKKTSINYYLKKLQLFLIQSNQQIELSDLFEKVFLNSKIVSKKKEIISSNEYIQRFLSLKKNVFKK